MKTAPSQSASSIPSPATRTVEAASATANAWTGGQYSLWRAFFGLYLAVHFAVLLPYGAELFSNDGMLPDGGASPLLRLFPNVLAFADTPAFVAALLALGVAASALLAIGWRDRVAALFLAYLLACLYGRNPLISNPSLPYVGWLLLAHALVSKAPYGSLAARGRTDPAGGWTMPARVWTGAWIVMAVGYTYSGISKLASPSWIDGSALARVLENPLGRPGIAGEVLRSLPASLLVAATYAGLAIEILFAPLALLPHARRWIWSAMLALHLGLVLLVDCADLSIGMVVLHLFTFDPRWLRPAKAGVDVVFYDGSCGLCHRLVRCLLSEESSGEAFVYAPLQGETFASTVPEDLRARLPDSVVVKTADGRILIRSEAALHVLERCGGAWRACATAARIVPASMRDWIYDRIARIRYRLFARPKEACPLVPRALASRFRP